MPPPFTLILCHLLSKSKGSWVSEINKTRLMREMRRLSLEAGDIIMEIYGADDFQVETKSDESPVTVADQAADAHISAGLTELFPDIPLVTEEQANTHVLKANTFLIVDPLDGTKEFIKRRGDFTVNIALVEDGVPTLGVGYAPAKERLFLTDAEGGAHEETAPFGTESEARKTPISVSVPDNGALKIVASKSHRDAATEDYIAQYATVENVSAGSSLKFCLVATGEADFYPRLGPTMEWDTAAGHAVLSAAGGQVVNREGHETLAYGKPEFRNPHFLAFAPGVELKEG